MSSASENLDMALGFLAPMILGNNTPQWVDLCDLIG